MGEDIILVIKFKNICKSIFIFFLFTFLIYSPLTKANQYADEAKEAKKTGKPHNIGAILFFLPGYGMTLKNIEDALTAAKERAEHLNKIKEKKNC